MNRLTVLIILLASMLPAVAAQPVDSLKTSKVQFAWGAEMGGSADMSGNDMSSFDFNIAFGMRYRWLKFLGLGTGANIMVSNSCRTFPVYCELQTDFHNRPRLLFLDLKGGVGFNYLENNRHYTGAYAYAGMGINFARTSKFSSFMSVGYSFIQRRSEADPPVSHPDIHLATIKIGINF